jgi:hypothetical protein
MLELLGDPAPFSGASALEIRGIPCCCACCPSSVLSIEVAPAEKGGGPCEGWSHENKSGEADGRCEQLVDQRRGDHNAI